MRQVIRRFLKHLDAEKNASVTTIESYKYDLHKFDVYLVKRLGNRFLPGDVTHDHIRDYLYVALRSRLSKTKRPLGSCPDTRSHPVVFQIRPSCCLLRDNPAADTPLPKIRRGEVRALSHDECDRLLRIVATIQARFEKSETEQ